MKCNSILPTRSDVANLDFLSQTVDDCAVADKDQIATLYWSIGKILLGNIRQLGIDEDIAQLLSFSRSMACEMLAPAVRTRNFGDSCWAIDPRDHCPPYLLKIDGSNRPNSEIRSEDRQIVAMVHLFAHHLMRDPNRVASAQALLLYESSNELWTQDDFVDRE